MSQNKIVKRGILLSIAVLVLAGCYKDRTVLIANNGTQVTSSVSFAGDIVPIFSKSCSMSGCHNTGGQVPDLTPGNAYRTINEQNLIDLGNPENSEIYGWLTGTIKPAMPLGAPSNPSNINALVLAWIKQGAKNN